MINKIINIDECKIILDYPEIINILLKDKTTKKNIIWATSDYEKLGKDYYAKNEITIKLILRNNNKIIQPRALKDIKNKLNRTKTNAEVSTPSWFCNKQNNLIDNNWFEEFNGFNNELYKSWETNFEKIIFKNKNMWKKYVDNIRMEITCGEAPYLVSRYDAVSGLAIPLFERIGLLDRKLRVVNENTNDESEWFKWVLRAYKSIYGFEFAGDSLWIARQNLLYTFIDNVKYKFKRVPFEEELLEIADIISWNIWQMDGLNFSVPYSNINISEKNKQISLFQDENYDLKYCLIKDWKAARWKKMSIIEYRSLINKED